MLCRLCTFAVTLALVPLNPAVPADETVTLGVPGIQCMRCVESLTAVLTNLDPSVKITPDADKKLLEVSYDPDKVTVHQLVAAVPDALPVHNRRYEAGLLVTIDDPAKSASKVKRALGQVKGVVNILPAGGGTAESADFMIILKPITPNTKPTDLVKATQISEAFERSGVRFSGLPEPERRITDEPDAKKKPGSRPPVRSKLGTNDDPERTKPARLTPATPKGRPARDTTPKGKEPEDETEEKPRFMILAGDSEKVYLVDHETKTDDGKELKKLVKEGDKFGEFVVKEVGKDEGLYVILEVEDGKETIRVEQKRKEKESAKEKDSPKEKEGEKVKDAEDKPKGEKKD